jgi:lipopolysaccharide biosynthesis protein
MKTAIILHLYYQDLWEEFKQKITPILNNNVHLYVSIHNTQTQYYDDILRIATQVFVVENRGLDIAPFLFVYDKIRDSGYTNLLKLHSKKSLHTPNIGDNWRQSLYFPLVDNYDEIQQQVQQVEQPWMLGVREFYHDMLIEPKNHPNKLAAKPYIDRACELLQVEDDGSFFAGTMFIANSTYLKLLLGSIDLEHLYTLFEEGYTRDSLAHGMERVLGYGIQYYKGTYYTI